MIDPGRNRGSEKTTMKISPFSLYRTRNGLLVRVYVIDGGDGTAIHGATFDPDDGNGWSPESWRADGCFMLKGERSNFDIVSEAI